jgi:hypothetical protein
VAVGGQRRPEAIDVQLARGDVGCDQQHGRVERQDEQEADPDREREPQRRDHGRQHRVEDRDDPRHREGIRLASLS